MFPESPLSLEILTFTTEEERFNKMAGCLHSSVLSGHHRQIHTSCNDLRLIAEKVKLFYLQYV